ncbi:MAG TPA: 3-oxoacyl-ACP reductase family protein [Dehalococcoidia bacterium]|nr:3-oxoacyl-ACP reductase family protein [Dehalococcoidia bacterium]
MGELTGQVAIVTGAAQGIGRAIAERLRADGARVVVADLNRELAEETAQAIDPDGESAIAIGVDVADSNAVAALIDRTRDRFGRIDVLVNNAGWSRNQPFLDDTPDYWDRVIAVNFKAVVACSRAVLDAMIAQGGGRIVNIASDAGRVGTPREAVYAGAKAGIIGFTKSLAAEMARHQITVNVICPATTDTPLVRGMLTDDQIARRVRAIPLGRLGRPEDIAHAVAYFVSPGAGWVTGQVLSVNGGMTRLG